jgi:hypothetical protein
MERLKRQNKMFVRDRIELLLDPGTPFLELSTLAANQSYDGEVPGAGIVESTTWAILGRTGRRKNVGMRFLTSLKTILRQPSRQSQGRYRTIMAKSGNPAKKRVGLAPHPGTH